MKTIKTRNSVKNVKVLDKSINIQARMKDAFIRTKESAEEIQNSSHATPTDYASDNIQTTARGATEETVHHFSNPRQKARDSIERAKGHFQEVKRQMPKERQRAADGASKTANNAKSNADNLHKTAEHAQDTAQSAKSALKDAKNNLREVRQSGRQTLREVKQSAKPSHGATGDNGLTLKEKMLHFRKSPSQANANPARKPPDIQRAASQPDYLSGGARNPAKSLQKSAETTGKTVNSTNKGVKKTAKGTIKTAKKSVKTAEQTAKKAVKTAKQTAKTAQKSAQAAAKAAKIAAKASRAAAKVAVHTAKAAIKATTAMVKAAIAAVKGLVAIIAAGGWVAILVILVICMIGLLIASIFSIFFSSEPSPQTGMTINGVITEINAEYTANIDSITAANSYDLLDMSGARASWKEVLAVYTVKTVTDPDNPMEVATMDDEKAAILKSVFWEMNSISHTLDSVDIEEDIIGEDGLPTGDTTVVTKSVLRIVVTHKTPEEMAAQYGFTDEQKEWLTELLKPEHNNLWNALLYGISSVGDGTMIEIADTQIGNIGGEIYRQWYGLASKDNWCAAFVSWCAEQCGYLDTVIPRFSSCKVGIQWFNDRGQWQDNTYTPSPGDLIFFDWEPDGICDHVGIVESVTDGRVNTIEGNTSDSVARRSYDLGSVKIFGYGVAILP